MGNLCKALLLSGGLLIVQGKSATAQTAGTSNGQHTCSITVHGKTAAWQHITATRKLKLQPRSGTAKLPTRFTVYTINEKQLKDFLKAAKQAPDHSMQMALPLSEGQDCASFLLANANTMSAGLAAKYPELVSLKGTAGDDSNALLRLDYDGTDLRAEITRSGTIYLIAPWKSGKKKYYLVYKKEDAGIERRHSFRG